MNYGNCIFVCMLVPRSPGMEQGCKCNMQLCSWRRSSDGLRPLARFKRQKVENIIRKIGVENDLLLIK